MRQGFVTADALFSPLLPVESSSAILAGFHAWIQTPTLLGYRRDFLLHRLNPRFRPWEANKNCPRVHAGRTFSVLR